MHADRAALYAEDMSPGTEFGFATWTLSEQDIVAYARVWDPLPMHTDPQAAAGGPFGGLIASGLQTMAVYQRLAVDALWSRVDGKAGRGFQIRMRRPVRPGTTLSGAATVAELTVRPERGDAIVVLHAHLADEAGEVVLEVVVDAVITMRPGA